MIIATYNANSIRERLPVIEPSPIGDSHIGPVKSGEFVQVRFPMPKEKPLGYWVELANIVAFAFAGRCHPKLPVTTAEFAGSVLEM